MDFNCTKCELHTCRVQVKKESKFKPEIRYEVKPMAMLTNDPSKVKVLFLIDRPWLDDAVTEELTVEKMKTLVGVCNDNSINYKNIAISFAIRCPTTDLTTKKPVKSQIDACKSWLAEELEQLTSLKAIVTLGTMAYAAITGRTASTVSSKNSKIMYVSINGRNVLIMPSVNIYSAMRDPYDREILSTDLARMVSVLQNGQFDMGKHKEQHKDSYVLVDTEEKLAVMQEVLHTAPVVTFDTETRKLDPWHVGDDGGSFLTSVQLYDGEMAWFVPVSHKSVTWEDPVTPLAALATFFESYKGTLVAFNAKFDQVAILHATGVCPNVEFDLMLADQLRRGLPARSLKILAWLYTEFGGYEDTMRDVGNELSEDLDSDVDYNHDSYFYPIDVLFWYGCLDVHVTYLAYIKYLELIKDDKKLGFMMKFLCRASSALAYIEVRGWKINTKYLNKLMKSLDASMDNIMIELRDQYGHLLDQCASQGEFNPTSAAHVAKFLKLLKVKSPKKTGTGQESFTKEVLNGMIDAHPVIPKILEYRVAEKLLGSFCKKWDKARDADSCVHFRYNLINLFNDEDKREGTNTGRLSSSGPSGNIQAIKKDPVIRRAFIPDDEDSVILDVDYRTLEYVVFARYSNEPKMNAYLTQGHDIHAAVAATMFNSTPEAMMKPENKAMRSKGKTLNFGALFGAGPTKVAEYMKISKDEATAFLNDYFEKFPEIREWKQSVYDQVARDGYVTSKFGRIRQLPDACLEPMSSAHKGMKEAAFRRAVNSPIQSDASDICLWSLVKLHLWMFSSGKRSRILATIHDALVFSVRKDELDEVIAKVKDVMENPRLAFLETADMGKAPLRIEVTVGPNWGDTEKYEIKEKEQ